MYKKLYAVLVLLLSSMLSHAQMSATKQNDQNIFDISKNIDIFTQVLYNLQTYSLYDIEPNTITKEGLSKMLEGVDRYTRYYAESDVQDYLFLRTGKYEGLGLSFFKGRDSSIVISEIIAGGEAENSGLSIGDTIVSVNDKKLYSMDASQVRDYFQQIAATDIQLQVNKVYTGKQENLSIDKGTVKKNKLGYVGWLGDDKKTAIVNVKKFTPNCASLLESALDSLFLVSPSLESIVLDLRGNPGGLLLEAVKMVSLFVDGDQLVVYTQGRIPDDKKTYKTEGSAKYQDERLYVLIDTHSASASEIVSGALQDYDRAVLIGENSFGKGLVQNFRQLPFNTQMKLTTAKYYIPSGRCIQALDYAKKSPDGTPYLTPENQRRKFTTANGREVLDGRGITPDILVEVMKSDVLEELVDRHIIFEFVSGQIDMSQYKTKAEVTADLDKFLQRFYDFINKNDAWKTMSYYQQWLALVRDNESSDMLPSQQVQTFEGAMKDRLISKIGEDEKEVKNKIQEEVLRRVLDDEAYYEQNKVQDLYLDRVALSERNKDYNKILKK